MQNVNCEIKTGSSCHVYAIPVEGVRLIEEIAGTIEGQQRRRVASDAQIDQRIDQRIDNMLKALAARGMLAADKLDAKTLKAARNVCRDGLQNENGDALADDIGAQRSEKQKT